MFDFGTMRKTARNKIKREALKHLPRTLLRDKYLRPHYSQFGEDVIVCGFFDRHYQGVYVDVGAYHPRFLSNTYLLWLRNWRGVNIDANPLAVEAFKKERPTDINICCAIGKQRGTAKFHRFKNPAFNTLSADLVAAEPQRGTPVSVTEVPVLPLNEILVAQGVTRIDYLNVDVEGLDYDVIAAFDFARFAPQVISIEMADADFDQITNDPIYEVLREKDYEMVAYCEMTAIFRCTAPA